MIVAGVASQGHTSVNVFVRTYKIQYAETDLAFKFYPSDASPKVGLEYLTNFIFLQYTYLL